MRILGIDPGLHICGYGCLDIQHGEESLVEAGVFRTSTKATLVERLNQIADDTESVLKGLSPEIVAVEELYSHYAHPETAILMSHARGVILQKCAAVGIEVRSYSATRIKKSVTGNGRASKQQIQRVIQSLLALSAVPEPNDVADAIAVALCCANSITSEAYSVGS